MTTVDTVTVYQDSAGEYRWTAKAANHETIADSSEGYVHLEHAEKMAHELFPHATVIVDTETSDA